VLDTEKFVLRVKSSMSAIWKSGDELISGNVAVVIFRQLVCESALDRDGGKREDALGVCGLVARILDRQPAGGDGGDLTTMTDAGFAVDVWRVESRISASVRA
jgi:hypothetical protein